MRDEDSHELAEPVAAHAQRQHQQHQRQVERLSRRKRLSAYGLEIGDAHELASQSPPTHSDSASSR